MALLSEAIGEEIPDKVKLDLLSKAMYKEDAEEAKKEFSEILGSLSPDVVSLLLNFLIYFLVFCVKVSSFFFQNQTLPQQNIISLHSFHFIV